MDKEAQIQELLSLIGEPAQIARNLERFARSGDAFEAQYSLLLERYPDRWVAFDDGTLKATAETLDQLLAETDRLGIPRATLYVRHVMKDEPILIL